MTRKKSQAQGQQQPKPEAQPVNISQTFHLDFATPSQKLAWMAYQKHDLLFLLGAPGSGKTYCSTAFAIHDLLKRQKERLFITRPTVEAGDSLGFLPGSKEEKIHPYMVPMYECIDKICGKHSKQKELIIASHEAVPLQFLRGRTMENCVFIFDEAQNATKEQLKLAITRMGQNCKMIITGDPDQTDITNSGLEEVVSRISGVHGVGLIRFKESSIVRHPLLAKLLKHF